MTEQERLNEVLDNIDRAAEADSAFGYRSTLVMAEDRPGDDYSIALIDLDGRKATDAVLGFTAPDDLWALGSICGGWAAPADTEGSCSAHPDASRARLVTLVTRSGLVAYRLSLANGKPRTENDSPIGPAVDSLMRAMGLATPEPEYPVLDLFTSLWLSSIEHADPNLSWRDVVALHPIMEYAHQLNDVDTDVAGWAACVAGQMTWADVRDLCRNGWLEHLVDPAHADWMDDGMLARYLILQYFPSIDAATARAKANLRADVADQLDATLKHVAAIT